ncbi:MAG TPA: UbiA family prenyltransferase [Candidatus Omnitrophota bacterium]|nr:UbiA family prenyltransferase [Candidatus Omnitrophota bacterium]HNX82468.1 UbiA family prenyltransferase [Candidatus Omnitrophota bacterium]HPT06969.1 UbiA family prenyltransferase [Candidatus Omnitrophota bacterium]
MWLSFINERVIKPVENGEVAFGNYIGTFVAVIIARIFLEVFSDSSVISFDRFAHYSLFYVCLALSFILVFHYATKEPVVKIARTTLTFSFLIILAPLFDLLLSKGQGFDMTYFLPGVHGDLGARFLTYAGSFNGSGVTPGMRIEIGIILICSFLYLLVKTRTAVRSLIGIFFIYSLLFLYGLAPFGVKALLGFFNFPFVYSDSLMRDFYLFLLLIFVPWFLYVCKRAYFVALIKDMRFARILHYLAMWLFGFAYAGSIGMAGYHPGLFYWFFIPAAIIYAGCFSLITNNLSDVPIDAITNTGRPLVTGAIPPGHYTKVGWFCLGGGILYAGAVGFTALLLVLVLAGSYYLYSMPPVRFKRVTFFSKICIAICSLATFLLGYNGTNKSVEISFNVAVYFLIWVTAAGNFIDLKDYEGDKQAGIRTLPVVFGLRRAQLFIACFFFCACICIPWLVPDLLIVWLSRGLAVLVFFLIWRKSYNERPIFAAYLFGMAVLIVYLLHRHGIRAFFNT